MKILLFGLMFSLMSVVLIAADKVVDPAQSALDAAKVIFADGKDYPGAQAAFEKVLKDYPTANVDILAEVQKYVGISLNYQQRGLEAQAAFEKVLKDYPTANVDILADAQLGIGGSLVLSSQPAEAQAAFEKVLTNYPTASAELLVAAQMQVACVLRCQGKPAEAQVAFEKVITEYPTASLNTLADAQEGLGYSLKEQGKQAEAQTAFMTFVQNYVCQLGATNEQSRVWQAFDLINPKLVAPADYKTFIENTIKAVKTTEANAKFLDRLKSELKIASCKASSRGRKTGN